MANKKIAITGGIGSGKSYISTLLREMGYPVFSCDEIYKEIACSNEYLQIIENLFPGCIENGILDRKKLGSIVFSDQEQLAKLNAVAHPLIMKRLLELMSEEQNEFAFGEVPLLFEGGYEIHFDETIFVKRNLEDRIQAVMRRDSLSREKVLNRVHMQFDYESEIGKQKTSNAIIIENNTTIKNLKNRLREIIKQLS